jgi:hypothetical protein
VLGCRVFIGDKDEASTQCKVTAEPLYAQRLHAHGKIRYANRNPNAEAPKTKIAADERRSDRLFFNLRSSAFISGLILFGPLQSARDFTPAGPRRLDPKPALLPDSGFATDGLRIATTRGAEDVNWCAQL